MDVIVVGGGTATNAVATVFPRVAATVVYVVPISDNGGSTSEILRVLGGPAIGDARSRLVRLMAPTPLRDLLEYRLPGDEHEAAAAWSAIVEGEHPRWVGIPSHLKHMYRAFFIQVAAEILKRRRPGTEMKFSFASVGNFLLSGARIFFGSLDAAIEFVLRTARVSPRLAVLPALNTNFSHHIAARLADGSTVVGQTEISHPSDRHAAVIDDLDDEVMEDANIPFSHPSLASSQISFSKDHNRPLSAPVERVFYVNPYGAEIKPRASKRVVTSIEAAGAVVYSVGSLYTSIIPVILLQGFARTAMAKKVKIFMLNGTNDRETTGMHAYDFLSSFVRACYYSMGASGNSDAGDWTQFVTHLVYLEPHGGNAVPVEVAAIERRGVRCVRVTSAAAGRYDLDSLTAALDGILQAAAPAGPASAKIADTSKFPHTYPHSDF